MTGESVAETLMNRDRNYNGPIVKKNCRVNFDQHENCKLSWVEW